MTRESLTKNIFKDSMQKVKLFLKIKANDYAHKDLPYFTHTKKRSENKRNFKHAIIKIFSMH